MSNNDKVNPFDQDALLSLKLVTVQHKIFLVQRILVRDVPSTIPWRIRSNVRQTKTWKCKDIQYEVPALQSILGVPSTQPSIAIRDTI